MVPIYHLSPPISNPFPTLWSHAPNLRRRHPAAARLHRRRRHPPAFIWDARIDHYRAQAAYYRDSLEYIKRTGVEFKNTAPRYNTLSLQLQSPPDPHPHQAESIAAWKQHGRRGVVVLPTGSGKSHLALLAMIEVQRSALVVAPTIDLMNQWYDLLSQSFGIEVGLLGGGYHEIEDLTVATYDSAYMHVDRLGNRWGLVVFYEVHHLPGEIYSHAAEMCLAPYRFGLTATPERADGRHIMLDSLVGPIAYERGIKSSPANISPNTASSAANCKWSPRSVSITRSPATNTRPFSPTRTSA